MDKADLGRRPEAEHLVDEEGAVEVEAAGPALEEAEVEVEVGEVGEEPGRLKG
jgi:hypothetical protein